MNNIYEVDPPPMESSSKAFIQTLCCATLLCAELNQRHPDCRNTGKRENLTPNTKVVDPEQ